MSTPTTFATSSPTTPAADSLATNNFPQSLSSLGLGYAIAIAFGVLVLISTIILSSYLCCRRSHSYHRHQSPPRHPSASDGGIILPRIVFVAEDDNDDDENRNGAAGLDQSVINSYPKFPYTKNKSEMDKSSDKNNSMCSICLCDYKEAEMLRMMPDCKHFFHLCCLDAWLRLNGSCPVCRNSPLPTPLSTPLAEVVPLSHYPDNRRRS
ncbi:hypothetical protein Nepgr_002309 [Nepenthes gracilis]|uniref:RING-type domain-containing protein n=1 Tax=Nepenthes gracilis TaxID=150966 RepID=A0AAD3RYD2_NEPGR|nr:hypothetical protein Nepgr_002309 [Nepenthes gracilis]